jgi:hypothetical protein
LKEEMMRFVRPTPAFWAVTLLAAGLAGDAFFMCGMNLVAFATIAATTLRLRLAAIVSLGVWAESQAVGFTLKDYPHDTMTLAWGAALGVATFLATLVAAKLAERGKLAAFATAFGVYEITLAAFAVLSRNGLAAFTPGIVLKICASNASIALAVLLLYAAAGSLQGAIVRGARARSHA